MRIEDFQTHFNGHVPGLLGAGSAYAVLVPLVRRRGAAHLLFEVRADTLNRQPGEVCFPGGRIEAGEPPTTCALREMEEELSIPPDAVHLLAELDFLYHQSGTLIHPILAEVDAGALRHMRVNTAEVKDTFLVPFSFFLKHKPILYSYDLEPHIPEDFPYHLLGYETGYPWHGCADLSVRRPPDLGPYGPYLPASSGRNGIRANPAAGLAEKKRPRKSIPAYRTPHSRALSGGFQNPYPRFLSLCKIPGRPFLLSPSPKPLLARYGSTHWRNAPCYH